MLTRDLIEDRRREPHFDPWLERLIAMTFPKQMDGMPLAQRRSVLERGYNS